MHELGPHHLIRPPQVVDRDGEDVDQAGEGEQQEHRQAEEQVQLVDEGHLIQQFRPWRPGDDALGPFGQVDHDVRVPLEGVIDRHRDGHQSQAQGDQQPVEDEDVHEARGGTHPGMIHAPPPQNHPADHAQGAEQGAGGDGDDLMGHVGDAEAEEHLMRGQEPGEMPEEQHDDAGMEEAAAFLQLFLFQQLAGVGLPGVLLTVVAQHVAHQEHSPGDEGIDAEKEVRKRHGYLLFLFSPQRRREHREN